MAGFYRIENLTKNYTPDEPDVAAAVDIKNLQMELGGIIAIIGGSGSGKTTFLNLISGLEAADNTASENKRVLDLRLPDDTFTRTLGAGLKNSRKKESFPHDKVSYVFQQGYLLNHASIRLNLAMTRRAAGLEADEASLNRLLELAQLNSSDGGAIKKLSDRAITLSGGQQQRINIARALGREPALLFADELTSSLDPDKARDVLTQLKRWIWDGAEKDAVSRKELKRCMIWVTHDYRLASEFADAVLVMNNGKLAEGSVAPVERNSHMPHSDDQEMLSWVHTGIIPERFVGSTNYGSKVDFSSVAALEENTQARINSDIKEKNGKRITKTASALGNLYSGIRLSLMDSYRQPYPSRWRIVNLMKRVVRPLFGFSNWVRSLQLAAILGLIMLVTYGRQEVVAFFDEQLQDPSLRHVIVNQNMREPDSSVINNDSLSDLESTIAAMSTQPNTTAVDHSRSAFGRFTEYVSVYPEGVDEIADQFVAETAIGILDREEPVYSTLKVQVIDPDSPGCMESNIGSLSDLIPYDDELAIVLSKKYVEDAKKMFDVDFCENPYIDLWDRDTFTFRVVGIVDQTPADGYDNFDALMQIDVWHTWYSLMDKRQINNLSRAAVYFDRKNHESVIGELFNRSFAFDQEIVTKFKRLMSTSAQLRNTFVVLTWLALLVAVTVAAGLIWSYLLNNAKSIAVLRAHNAWFWPLFSAIPFQLILTFIYALFYLLIGGILWNALVNQSIFVHFLTSLSDGDWAPTSLGWQHIKSTISWVFGSLLAMILVGWTCLGLWRVTHRKLAHELRQAY